MLKAAFQPRTLQRQKLRALNTLTSSTHWDTAMYNPPRLTQMPSVKSLLPQCVKWHFANNMQKKYSIFQCMVLSTCIVSGTPKANNNRKQKGEKYFWISLPVWNHCIIIITSFSALPRFQHSILSCWRWTCWWTEETQLKLNSKKWERARKGRVYKGMSGLSCAWCDLTPRCVQQLREGYGVKRWLW